MTNFVLLHGAWHGGWCWKYVAAILRARGHRVTTPTQTGLGERAHLMSPEIDLATFGRDLVNHLRFEDLDDAVLVGHSFGGSPISYAAEQARDRVRSLVYFDAIVVEGGETPISQVPGDVRALRRQLAQDSSGGLSLPAPPAVALGVMDAELGGWVEKLMTPHPMNTFETALTIDGPPGAGLSASYLVCTDPVYPPLEASRQRARGYGWPVREIATGHDAMVTAPETLADLLEACA